jgi:hypothetical protein
VLVFTVYTEILPVVLPFSLATAANRLPDTSGEKATDIGLVWAVNGEFGIS